MDQHAIHAFVEALRQDAGDGYLARLGDDLCAAAAAALRVDGAGITVTTRGEHLGVLGGSDPTFRELEHLQVLLHEGPCLTGAERGEVVVEPDLAAAGVRRWPEYARRATRLGVRAAFAFPLDVRGIRLGTISLYRRRPGGLSELQLAGGQLYASTAVAALLALYDAAPLTTAALLDRIGADHARLHQAAGVLAVRQHLDLPTAARRLREHALATDRPLPEVVDDLLADRLHPRP